MGVNLWSEWVKDYKKIIVLQTDVTDAERK